jgi:hypothetical protein
MAPTSSSPAEGVEARADRLLSLGLELVGRVRDDDPDAVARWLAATVDGTELRDMAIILAALIPDDRTPRELLAWFTGAKWCRGCERVIPLAGFAKDKSKRDGLGTYCRICTATKTAERRRGEVA